MTALTNRLVGAEILVIDDNHANLKLLTSLLEGAGYISRPADSARLALRSVQAKVPDLIVLDIKMPDIDGLELCRRFKENPATADIPVIFVTALASDEDRLAGYRVGAVDYITKPFRAEEILTRVRNHVALRLLRLDLEAAKRLSEERLRRVYESNMLAICFWREDGLITEANDAYCSILGVSQDDVRSGRVNYKICTPDEYADADARAIEELRSRGVCAPFEKEYRAINGEPVPVLLGSALLGTSPAHGVAYAIDMRPFKRLEARLLESQKLESLGVLAGGIAHDFNNLLTGILGNANLIRMRVANDPATLRNVDRIERAAERAGEVTRQMLAYAGKGRFVTDKVDLSRVARESIALLKVNIQPTARLSIDGPSRLPPLETDETQVRQIITNLVINASESLPPSGGDIRLTTGLMDVDTAYLERCVALNETKPGRFVYIEVLDTGCGMDSTTIARVLDPFFSTKFVGRGLGLPAIAGIVRAHHGAICLRSAPGDGTTIRVLFPIQDDGRSTNADADEKSLDSARPRRILVADDEETVRIFASDTLKDIGYEVLSARDGQEALTILATASPSIDLVLLDMTMPVLDGKATLRAIRDRFPGIPVVIMSGHSSDTIALDLASTPPDAKLQKPFKPSALRDLVARLIAPVSDTSPSPQTDVP